MISRNVVKVLSVELRGDKNFPIPGGVIKVTTEQAGLDKPLDLGELVKKAQAINPEITMAAVVRSMLRVGAPAVVKQITTGKIDKVLLGSR